MGLSKILTFLLDTTQTYRYVNQILNSFLKFINKDQFLDYQKVNTYIENITNYVNDEITNEITNDITI